MTHPIRPHRNPPRPVLLLAVPVTAVLGLPVPSAPAVAADPLLSRGRPVAASSTGNGGTPAAAAVGGSVGTRWSSAFAEDQRWTEVDLGATATISQVVLRWETAFRTLTKARVEATRGPWVFDHPFLPILDNAVGGDWPGPPDGSTVLPQRMSIDYVQVHQ